MGKKEMLLPLLVERKAELEEAITKADDILKCQVEGCLEVNRHNDHYRYYVKPFDETAKGRAKRKYIKDIGVAEAIANFDYAKRIHRDASNELKRISALIEMYSKSTADERFRELHPGRKLLVKPILIDDEQYADIWESATYKNHNSYPIISPIQTENNEIVRSKSEKIIADKLKISGIPYVYEKPLYIGKIIKYPDFTVLNKRTRKEYYWEHMGLIDDVEYLKNAIEKMTMYLKNGIIPGKNLIITYETSRHPLSVRSIETFINEYLV